VSEILSTVVRMCQVVIGYSAREMLLKNRRSANEYSYMYYVYIIECKDGTLYTGITTDIQRRFKEHNSGRGGAYTRAKKVKKVLYTEQIETRSEAQKREAEIKSWHRERKLALIKK